jgi:glycosyltransferase involved in cell wall biosynthesis
MAQAGRKPGRRRKGGQHADMSTSTPAISVLLPVYDAGRFLAPAVESILSQTFADFELIAIDDGSHDGSAEVLAQFAARDGRIRVFTQGNQGIVATLNRALSLARAPLVARMDADDVARPDRLAKQIDYLRQHPEIAVVSGAVDVIDEDGACLRTDVFPTSPETIANELIHRSCVCHPAVMVRTEIVRSVGGYRRNAQLAEDYDLWLRISEVSRIANLPDVLLVYRLHPVASSRRHVVEQELAALAARGAARLRRSGKADPLAASDVRFPLRYRTMQLMFADAFSRPSFAISFFRAVLGRATEMGSMAEWSRLYVRYGLWDLDGDGGAMMILLLGHNMLRQWRKGAPMGALIFYPFWALVTALRHPLAASRIALNARYWLGLARVRLRQQSTSSLF